MKLDPNSYYHSILIKQMGEKKAIEAVEVSMNPYSGFSKRKNQTRSARKIEICKGCGREFKTTVKGKVYCGSPVVSGSCAKKFQLIN